jgi:hypothetical protein
VVIAVSVLQQLHRGAEANTKYHLQHGFIFEVEIDVESFFGLVDVNGFDGFASGWTKRISA